MRSTRGFSLIELLFVLALVTVLAVFGISAMQRAQDRARTIKCMNNMRHLYGAFMGYYGEHNGCFPPGHLMKYYDPAEMHSDFNWKSYLVPDYIADATYCPAMRLDAEGLKKYPNEKARLATLAGYSINFYLLQVKLTRLPGPHFASYPYPGHHRMLFLSESSGAGATWSLEHATFALDGYSPRNLKPRSHTFRDALNFVFLDGHAETLSRAYNPTSGTSSWGNVFDSWGRDGRYIGPNGSTNFNPN